MSQVLKSKSVILILTVTFIFRIPVIAQSDLNHTNIRAINKKAFGLRNSDIQEGLKLNFIALNEAMQLTDDTLMSLIYSCRGVLYKNQREFDSASYYTFKSLELREKIGVPSEIAKSYNNLGSIFYESGQFEKAKDYYFKTLAIRIETEDTYELPKTYNNIGNVFKDLDLVDSSVFYYECGLMLEGGDYYSLCEINLNLGILYNKIEKPEKSLTHLLPLFPELEGTYDKALCAHNIGIAYELKEDYQTAANYYGLGQVYADSLDYYDLNKDLARSRFILRMKVLNDTIGLNLLNTYTINNDSLNQEIINSNIAEVEAQYKTEKIESQLKLEQEESKRVKAENNQQTITIIALLVLIAVIVVLVVIVLRFYRQKRKLTKLELEAKKNEIEQLMHGYELDLFEAQNFGQQEERQRIAEDLHDRLGGLLAAVNLQIESLMHSKTADNSTELTKVQVMLSEGINEVRNVAHNLRAEALKKHGLKGALESICQSIINSKKLNIDLYLDDLNEKIDPVIEKESYKIIMELLSNTLKHTNATLITLQISEIENELTLVYEDNGSGFIQVSNKKEGLGIPSINNRVSKLNGSFQIDSHPHSGTTVIIKIPQI